MKIKSALFVLLSLIALQTFAGQDRGGGDPFLVNAQPFPDPQKLEQSVESVKAIVQASNLSASTKVAIVSEINYLQEQDKFLYLESIILLGSDAPEGYTIPTDAGKFLGLGAMTAKEKGSNVYFSSRSLNHSSEKFSKLLLHEVLHHILLDGLSSDEDFIERLSSEIMSGNISPEMLNAVRTHIWMRPGYIASAQLFDFFYEFNDMAKKCGYSANYQRTAFLKSVPSNVAMMEMRRFSARATLGYTPDSRYNVNRLVWLLNKEHGKPTTFPSGWNRNIYQNSKATFEETVFP